MFRLSINSGEGKTYSNQHKSRRRGALRRIKIAKHCIDDVWWGKREKPEIKLIYIKLILFMLRWGASMCWVTWEDQRNELKIKKF